MRRLFVTVFFAAVFLAAVTAPAGAIVGGTRDGSAHPYVGALIVSTGRPFCSGVLVANRIPGKVFLTSAHCLGQRGDGKQVRVTFGATVSSGPTFVGTYHVMPGYVRATFANDIAVVVFNSWPTIAAVNLDDGDTWLGPGAIVTTVGYGTPDTGVRKSATEVVTGSGSSWIYLRAGSGNSCDVDSGGPDLVRPDADDPATLEVVALTDQGSCSRDQDYKVTSAAVRHFVNNP
jgi:hypothetical protein